MKRLPASIATAVALGLPSIGWGAAQVALQWPGTTVGYTQLDPHGAAGPVGILEANNNGISYYSKTGGRLWTTNEQAFFPANVCCDCKFLYDPASSAFFAIAQDSDRLHLQVAVSRSSNPLSATTNDWRLYKFSTGSLIDYPGIGLDSQALYASYGNGQNVWMVLNKAQLLSGNTNASTAKVVAGLRGAPGVNSQGLQAVSVIGSASPGDVAYCVTRQTGSDTITLYAITNVLGTQAFFSTNIPAPPVGSGPILFAPQQGTTNRVNPGSNVAMGNAFWNNGELWFCEGVSSTNQPERTVIRYYKLKTDGYPFNTNAQVTLAEWGDLDGGTNTWRQHPSIAGNPRGDVCLTFTQTSSNSTPTMYAAIRAAGQTAFSTLLIRASAVAWTNNSAWCDYSVVTPDPEDQTFWAAHIVITGGNSVIENWANITRDNLFYVDANATGTEAGTRAQPFHTVRNAQVAASGAMTFDISPANYPETSLPLLINKNVRLENPYPSGIVHIGP